MAFSSQFPGAPWLNATQPQKANGLLGLLGVSSNPFTDFLGNNSNALIGLGAGIAGGGPDLGQAVGQGLTLAGQGKTADFARSEKQKADALLAAQTNQTQQWLQKNRPDLAGLPVDQAWQIAMKTQSGTTPSDPADVATYKFYAAQEQSAGRTPKPFDEWFRGSKQAVKSGLGQPIYGKNRKTGEYVPFEPMSDGSITSLTDPNANPADFIFDPGTVASDKAAGAAYGGAQGAGQYNLPAAKQNIDVEMANIDAILNDKQGLDEVFGKIGGVIPQQWSPITLPGTAKANIQERIKQVVGENFLQAYASLKGAGAITEVEGGKAQDAMARMSQAQSQDAFMAALNDLKAILQTSYARMSSQAGGGPYQSTGFTPPPLAGKNYVYNPATGELE